LPPPLDSGVTLQNNLRFAIASMQRTAPLTTAEQARSLILSESRPLRYFSFFLF
jgi:hypothetical protein